MLDIKPRAEDKIIKATYQDIHNGGDWPAFGSPETKCCKCMFFNVACFPRQGVVGCYGGWKKEAT